jgi:hypothetical protein
VNSKLQRIEESAFLQNGFTSNQVPVSIEVLCKWCFSHCRSFVSVTFECGSKLREIAANAFALSPLLYSIQYPSSLSEWSLALSSSIVDND